ncbi:hypothetical protein [Limosilactobacillus sp.]|uniref:hypothetical protein n=1 Tax=Limosilactobacillus sp. TaxID=2773925 RepID=UPI00345E1AD5
MKVGAASFHDPLALPKIVAELPMTMDKYGIEADGPMGGKILKRYVPMVAIDVATGSSGQAV